MLSPMEAAVMEMLHAIGRFVTDKAGSTQDEEKREKLMRASGAIALAETALEDVWIGPT